MMIREDETRLPKRRTRFAPLILLLLCRYSIPRASRNDSRKVLFFFFFLFKKKIWKKADDMKGDVHSVNRQPEVEKRDGGGIEQKKKKNVNGRFDTM